MDFNLTLINCPNFYNYTISGLASHYPEPEDKKTWLKSHIYSFNYESSMPKTWPWPQMPMIQTREMDPIQLA